MPITVEDLKKLPPQGKALIVVLVIFLICYLFYFYFLSDILDKKSRLEEDYADKQAQIEQKEKVARQLGKYKADVALLEENYKIALLKLPDQREIPGLFHSVAMAGQDARVEFALFEPKASVPKTAEPPKVSDNLKPSDKRQEEKEKSQAQKPGDQKEPAKKALDPFYEEIPVKVTVTGNFQNILSFFEKVAKLPRIVNVSEITLGERKEVKGKGFPISASCIIKTYMFVDKEKKTSEVQNEKK